MIKVSPVPASPSHLCRFVAFLARSKPANSILQHISALKLLHLQLGFVLPADSFHVRSLITGIKRRKGQVASFKLPLLPKHLYDIKCQLNLASVLDARFFAIMLTCFFGLLRIGDAFRLKRKDVIFVQNGAVLNIQHSKTNQFSSRTHQAVLPSYQNHPLCPVAALKNFMRLAGAVDADAPFFSTPAVTSVFSSNTFRSRLSELLKGIELPATSFSSHSLRRGGATWLLSAGVPLERIKLLGDWRSDAVSTYLKPTSLQRLSFFPNPSTSL